MCTVTLVGAGQMASALTFPLFENGHEVRLVGSPLDDEIIERLRQDNYHVNLQRTLRTELAHAIASPEPDIEDALIAAVAESNNVSAIITRDTKAFIHTSIPSYSPAAFLAEHTRQQP